MTPRSKATGALLLLLIGLVATPVVCAQDTLRLTASPAVLSPAGGTITFTVAVDYEQPITALSIRISPPATGWTFGATAGTHVPQVAPRAGDTVASGEGFGFLYFNIPARQASFTFTVRYPARLTTPQAFVAAAQLARLGAPPTVVSTTETLELPATAPTISTQPTDANVATGSSAAFSVTAAGSAPLAYQWRKAGVALPGETSATLAFAGVTPADAGAFDVVVTNAAGSITSRTARLTVTTAAAAPTVVTQPAAATTGPGNTATFTVTTANATNATYLWQRLPAGSTTWSALANSTVYSGVTTSTLAVRSATTAMGGDQFRCIITTTAGSTTTAPARLTVAATATVPPAPAASRLVNLSVRANAGVGADALVVGFVIAGGQKQVLVRGVGPALSQFGVQGHLADPLLTLYNASSTRIGSNDNWGGVAAVSRTFSQVGAFTLPATSKDAALTATLAAGACSAVINGAGSTTGIALAEVYDADARDASARFMNLAARNRVGSGDAVLVIGFAIEGGTAAEVLLRGIGPSLTQFGVEGALADPVVRLFNQKGELLEENDNWGGTAALHDTFAQTGAFALPPGSQDAALKLTLPPGVYTAQLSGNANTSGIALVEVYHLR